MKKLTDGRKPVTRTLPPLAEACGGFPGFQETRNRVEQVMEILTEVIQRNRRSTPQAFYAMRDVAEFFGVSLSTVAKAYRRLGREGMLTLVRSSQTMIAPRSSRPRSAIRGVICTPIWLPGFLQFLDWRSWFSELEEELSQYRFVLEPIFYRQNEGREFVVDRILKFNPDYLLWNNPVRTDCPAMKSVADTGVSIIVVQNTPGVYPGRIYHQSFEQGLRQGLKEWEADDGIERIVVPQSGSGGVSATQIIKPMLKACSLPHRFERYGEDFPLADYLQRLAPDPGTGIIFDDDLFYTWLCSLAPEMMLDLFRRRRVMVMRRSTLLSFKASTDVRVDALLFPGQQLARRIAADLGKGKGPAPLHEPVFEAEWRARTPLAEVAQNRFNE